MPLAKPAPRLRGYGAEHRRLRRKWKRMVDAGGVSCARCGQLIASGQPWDLGHVDGDKTQYQGPEHQRCNRAANGRNRRIYSRQW